MSFKFITFNIHKGFNWNNSLLTLPSIKQSLEQLDPDIIFLQEVVGENTKYQKKIKNWSNEQEKYIAQPNWQFCAYSKNAIYEYRHHGNAILSKYPIVKQEYINISTNQMEQRGVLFCELEIEQKPLHLYCVHLNLLHHSRKKQYKMITQIIKERTTDNIPFILSGDFNDWGQKASKILETPLNCIEAHRALHNKYAKTFPNFSPVLPLDRIYIKGLTPQKSKVLKTKEWASLSDHLPLYLEASIL